jgi:N-acetylglutamate synthase-like GNAT family acetyltransferase
MIEVNIRRLNKGEATPYKLLLEADPSRELIDRYLKNSEIYVAESDEVIVGVCVLYPVSSETVEIKNISVDDAYQKKGIGALLLHHAIRMANESHFKEIIIGTGNTSVGQLYLYQKVGFEITSIKKNFFIDNYPETLYENGIQVKHMIVLTKKTDK